MFKRSLIEKIVRLTKLDIDYPLHYMLPVYHSVSDDHLPHIRHIISYKNRKQFEKDIDDMSRNFCFADWDYFKQHYNSPGNKPLALLTFDDGFYEFKDVVLPILERKGIYAINFINPAFVGNRNLMYRCKVSLLIERINERSSIPPALFKLLNTKSNAKREIIQQLGSVNYKKQEILTEAAVLLEYDFSGYLKNNKVYLDLSDLNYIKNKGYGIAAHSWDHPYYNELSVEEQLHNTNLSIEYMKNNRFIDETFAFPFTDFGVKNDFFVKLFAMNPDLAYTFGCAGVKFDSFSRNLQRIPMENGLSAEDELRFQSAYFMLKKYINKNTITRE